MESGSNQLGRGTFTGQLDSSGPDLAPGLSGSSARKTLPEVPASAALRQVLSPDFKLRPLFVTTEKSPASRDSTLAYRLERKGAIGGVHNRSPVYNTNTASCLSQ